jgi:hypothetical protein
LKNSRNPGWIKNLSSLTTVWHERQWYDMFCLAASNFIVDYVKIYSAGCVSNVVVICIWTGGSIVNQRWRTNKTQQTCLNTTCSFVCCARANYFNCTKLKSTEERTFGWTKKLHQTLSNCELTGNVYVLVWVFKFRHG